MRFWRKKPADAGPQKAMLICAPIAWEQVTDSIMLHAFCGHRVWIAPSGVRLIEEHKGVVETYCFPCSRELPGLAEATLRPVPGSLDELDRELGEAARAEAERAMAAWGFEFPE